MVLINKSKILIILLINLISIIYSCDDQKINPATYELYISISSDKYPSISPDGTQLAYYHQCLDYKQSAACPTGLYIQDIDGTNKRLLIEGGNIIPDWSPDGKWIVYTSNGVLQVINIAGDSLRTFEGINGVPLSFPDWSSNGKMILMSSSYVVGGGVFITTPLLENARQLFDQYLFSGFAARWSHDMDKIIYNKVSHDWPGGEIFIIDILGFNDLRITNDKADDRHPVLSNTSDMIAWSMNVRITVMRIDGTGKRILDFGQNPSWSPYSDYIVYSNANQDFTKEVLWKINIDGSGKTQLTY